MALTKVSYAMINGAPTNPLDYGATGNGSSNDSAAILAANAAATVIELSAGTYRIGTNLTLTKPVISTGGIFKVASGVTLTLVNVESPSQIFDTSLGGTVVFSKAPPVIYPEWWGAVGDDSTDDTTAIQACFASIASTGGFVQFSAKTYLVSAALNVPTKTIVAGDGSGIAELGATVIHGNHNGKILNCVQDGFVLRDICVEGPNNAAYTSSIGVYTAVTAVSPSIVGAANFTIERVYVLNCYDNININASYNGILSNVVSQHAQNIGIKALSAQGQWNQVSSLFNKSAGIVINNYAGTNFNSGNASPTMLNIQTYNNGGAGIVVKGSYTGYTGSTEVSTQGLTIDQFFINNDALGGIIFDDHASANQVYSGSISNGQIQYCGVSSWSTRSNDATGIYIGTNVGAVTVSNVSFYDSASNHIQHLGQKLTVIGCNFTGAARGVPANALGAGNVYVAPPTPYGDNNNCVFGVGSFVIMSDCDSTDPLNLQGDYNRISNCWISTNYAATNSGGTAIQQVPTVNLANGSTDNYLTGVGMYQANTGSSASARSFGGQAGSSYSLINCQVYNNNGASATNSGTVITPYTP